MESKGLGFDRTPIVKGHGLNIPIPLGERLKAAKGVRQAVVKVTGFGRGAKGVGKAMDYIDREGELELELDSGEVIKGREEHKQVVKEWAVDFDTRKNSRDTASIVFSMPPQSKVEALKKAVRATLKEQFPGHQWVFVVHEDRKHPHAHVILKMRGKNKEGKDEKLDLKKPDLHKLREVYAEKATEQGVPLSATTRAARGVGEKGVSRAVYQMRKKGITPEVDKQARREITTEIAQTGRLEIKPWEKAMWERNRIERDIYRQQARELRQHAAKEPNNQKQEELLGDAKCLEQFARTMPRPVGRRQRWVKEKIGRDPFFESPKQARGKESGLER